MPTLKKNLTPALAILSIALITAIAYVSISGEASAQGAIQNPLGAGTTVMDVINRVIDFALRILTPLAVIMVLLAGLLYMTAGGSEEKVKKAHTALLWEIIGIAVVLVAKSVEIILRNIFGAP